MPPTRAHIGPWIVGMVVAFIAGLVIGAVAATAGANSTRSATQTPKPPAAAVVGERSVPTTTTVPPKPVLPKPEDFTVAVKVLKKSCFGSAGCNVTYQIEPKYIGATPLPSGQEITVVYQILGGEDQQVNRFTVNGGKASFPEEEFIQTRSSKAELTAKVTEVF